MSALPTLLVTTALAMAQASPPAADEHREPRQPQTTRERRDEGRIRPPPRPFPGPLEQDQTRVDRLVEMAARTYRLDEMQKLTVRHEIEAMQAERRAAMGIEADEYDRLREEMSQMWNQTRAEGKAPIREQRIALRKDPHFQEIRSRMNEIERKYPFDWNASVQRVEAMLPAEQVERGRASRQERDKSRAAARERWRARQGLMGGATSRPSDSRERSVTNAEAQRPPIAGTDPRRPESAAETARAAEPVHPWEQYVKSFIAEHELTAAQSNAAMAILKDMRTRAAQIEKSDAERVAAASRIVDRTEREKRLAELRQPIERLFEELKGRLDALLTAAQRAKAKS